MHNIKIVGVNIFLEKRKTRLHVGILNKDAENYIFTYDDLYFRAKHVISLGPEFPLTEKKFISKSLFPSFQDRIPSTQNPAYPEYCVAMGIDPKESNPLILLSSIGRKGPSSFIFYPLFERKLTSQDVLKFRTHLNLTTREFAQVFELSQNSLNGLERNRIVGAEILKRLEIIINFPSVALYFFQINGGYLHHEKWVKGIETLKT